MGIYLTYMAIAHMSVSLFSITYEMRHYPVNISRESCECDGSAGMTPLSYAGNLCHVYTPISTPGHGTVNSTVSVHRYISIAYILFYNENYTIFNFIAK